MSDMSIAEMSRQGFYIGIAIALVPATATLLIASSRVILVNIIANAILRVVSGGTLGIDIYGISLIQLPFLWKISMISAVIGGSIVVFSLTAALIKVLFTEQLQHLSVNPGY